MSVTFSLSIRRQQFVLFNALCSYYGYIHNLVSANFKTLRTNYFVSVLLCNDTEVKLFYMNAESVAEGLDNWSTINKNFNSLSRLLKTNDVVR